MCSPVSGAKALKKRVCDLPYSISVKSYRTFWNRIKRIWSDRTKIALEKKVLKNKKFAETLLLFICKASYCQNLRAIEQIPFDLQLFKVSPPGEKIVSRKQRWNIFPASQTNAAHKHSQLGSQIEWFSLDCRKTRTKVITLTNHKAHRQSNEPIKTRSNYR